MPQHLVGHRWPLHASSTGKVLLAETPEAIALLPDKLEAYTEHTITDRATLLRELQQIHDQGFGVIDDELEEGLLSLSRPVRHSAGNMVAILTLNGPSYRFGRNRIPEALQSMQEIVNRLIEVFWHDA
jgi:DNA-binding IclR family transcriptional regulator